MLCLWLLMLPGCTGVLLRSGSGLALSPPTARLQRTVRTDDRRPARKVPPADILAIGSDEKQRLFQRFVEWQGAQDDGH